MTRAVRWRPRSSRQVWLFVGVLVLVACAEAIAVPAKRDLLVSYAAGFIVLGWSVTWSLRRCRDHAALAARLATAPRDDVPADVIGLVVAGKKIQAIRRYRDLTGVGLKEATDIIDSL